MTKRPASLTTCLLLLATWTFPLAAQETATTPAVKSSETGFTRFIKRGRLGGEFQTAIATYEDDKGRKVALIAAVHIADSAYYEKLKKSFKAYDALLFELVAPKGSAKLRQDRKSSSLISLIQRAMKNALDLEFQLDGIDYSQDNFIHADLTPSELNRKLHERGQNMFTMFLDIMVDSMRAARKNPKAQAPLGAILAALMSPNRAAQLKYIFAKQLDPVEQMMAGGKNSVLIHERNRRAMEVLDEQLAAGKKKLGIFYGAAHMPDMEKRLRARGFHLVGKKWIVAWDIPDTAKKPRELRKL